MKRININLQDKDIPPFMIDGVRPYLTEDEYPYVYLKQEITDDDFEKALDVITTYFMQKEISYIVIDLDARNHDKMPTKEMTLEELEKEIGCKIKIVNKKEGK